MVVLQEPNLRLLHGGQWSLQTNMVVQMADGRQFTVPAGFVTDFASSRVGRYNLLGIDAANSYASVLHDWLYKTNTVNKHQADLYFSEGLKSDKNVGWWDSFKGYYGVKLFGGFAWRAHRKEDGDVHN